MNDITVRESARLVSQCVYPIGAAILARHLCYYMLWFSRSGSLIAALTVGVFLYYSGQHTYSAFFATDEEHGRPIQPAAAWNFFRSLFYIQLLTGTLTLLAWWLSEKNLAVCLGCGTLSYLLIHRLLTPFDLFHRGRRFLTFTEAKKRAELLLRECSELGRLFFARPPGHLDEDARDPPGIARRHSQLRGKGGDPAAPDWPGPSGVPSAGRGQRAPGWGARVLGEGLA
jgi:hypothetical protein